ncbi:MAG TPA: TerC/Alx family metal homeostasis membrane protein [Candidatus Binatia bacterium]|jgi:tellurite resistance protein TerC|nr:TerC/Alx family metal homeostasis membrane protein [Candidatus Binatia bacterium]
MDVPQLWIALSAVLVLGLAADFWFHRKPRAVPVREAALWTAAWSALGLGFGALVFAVLGPGAGIQYLTGYALEWSLSLDNVFVFVVVLASLAVPEEYRHRALLVGALGSVVLRLGFILGGVALLHYFEWLLLVFGVFLIVAAVRFLRHRTRPAMGGADGRVMRVLRRVVPVAREGSGGRLLTHEDGRLKATPLLWAMLLLIGADVVFAVDSVPAIFGVTRDPFLAFASNALAVLGLRSLYFLLQGAMDRFRYLRPALAALLLWIGVKILISPFVELPAALSLAAIVVILGAGVGASLLTPARHQLSKEDVR